MLYFIYVMMKIAGFIVSTLLSFGAIAQTLDVPPIGEENYRAYEGGSSKVNIDTETPLDALISRLERDWEFLETGKGYWIGYTDLMYSIAAHKQNAIKPLTAFISRTVNKKAKYGGVCTLHLIGIQSTIMGRFYEEFRDEQARTALRSFLWDEELHTFTLTLLSRDPWLSDLPEFMKYLEESNFGYERLMSILQNYKFPGRPFTQTLEKSLASKEVAILQNTEYWSEMFIKCLMLNYDSMFIDLNIRISEEWKIASEQFNEGRYSSDSWSFGYLLQSATGFDPFPSYGELENKYYYTYFDGMITVYGTKLARNIWLSWWEELPADRKREIVNTNSITKYNK